MESQIIIARRIARELKTGMLVNLGIGIPTLVANYLPEGLHIFFQSENGLIGTGPPPADAMGHPMLTDAGGRPVTALPGACTFDSAMSFGLIRGGHLDMTVLGGLQVDEHGRLANSVIPGEKGAGGGDGRGDGPRLRSQAGHYCDAAYGQGQVENRKDLQLAPDLDAACRPRCNRARGHRFRGRECDASRDGSWRNASRCAGPDRGGADCAGSGSGNDDLSPV